LREASKALEHAGRAGQNDLRGLLERVEKRMEQALRSIDALRDDSKGAAAAARVATATELREMLGRLADGLQAEDPMACSAALERFTSVASPEAVSVELQRVRDLTDGYEFDEASHVVKRLLLKLEEEQPR
jgi:hypothetical protein